MGTLFMEFGDILVQFNIFDAMKHPWDDHSIFHIDLINDLVDDHFSDFVHDIDLSLFSDSHDYHVCSDSGM